MHKSQASPMQKDERSFAGHNLPSYIYLIYLYEATVQFAKMKRHRNAKKMSIEEITSELTDEQVTQSVNNMRQYEGNAKQLESLESLKLKYTDQEIYEELYDRCVRYKVDLSPIFPAEQRFRSQRQQEEIICKNGALLNSKGQIEIEKSKNGERGGLVVEGISENRLSSDETAENELEIYIWHDE